MAEPNEAPNEISRYRVVLGADAVPGIFADQFDVVSIHILSAPSDDRENIREDVYIIDPADATDFGIKVVDAAFEFENDNPEEGVDGDS